MTNKHAQGDLGFAEAEKRGGPVECLGMTFESDDARRAHFLNLLREKLQDPEFRKTPGFPAGSDEAILRMSDPPYYTACPNPFLDDFVKSHSRSDQGADAYSREPLAIDVSEGKYDSLYRAHAYHTKVPHLAIAPSILHYTRPGDIVLDGFCGSGMTGLAAQWCGAAPADYRRRIAAERAVSGLSAPEWGRRHCIMNDLGPAASFIAAGNNLPFNIGRFRDDVNRILQEVADELGWMYRTRHKSGEPNGMVNVTVWSEVFSCPECSGEINFLEEATSADGKDISKTIVCPSCGVQSSKEQMTLQFESYFDEHRRLPRRRPKRVPSIIEYTFDGRGFQKVPDAEDLALLDRIASSKPPLGFPRQEFPDCQMTRVGRMKTTGVQRVDDLFLARSAHVLWGIWEKAEAISCTATRRMLLFAVEQTISTGSVLNRYRPNSSFGNGPLRGVYYVPSQIAEASLFTLMEGILRRIDRGFGGDCVAEHPSAIISTGDCSRLSLGVESVDYIFTDPPFGENIYYADLNFITESWHGVFTETQSEAIVDRVRGKTVLHYQERMRAAFEEFFRVLKPGRWMTVVFSNSRNSVWRAIQESMGSAGFVVADVRTLDRKHGSFKQVTSSAVKQDLIISAYKPTEALTHRFELGHATAEGAWAFVREHLGKVPVFVGRASEGEVVAERTAQMLLDRMIAFHVQRGIGVPLSSPEFLQGLAQRFPERDGMYFLSDQVAEYDRKRTSVTELRQLSLFVYDEASAIQWVRQQLQDKPQSFQDLTPQYMREIQGWAKHEKTVELKTILEQSFLQYDGRGPVPSQIHRHLSTNYKDLRNLEKDDTRLVEKARDRWYVPDPNKQADLEQLRERSLLREFEEYKASTQHKLKIFRTAAMLVGFKDCWQKREYGMIVKVAEKLPDAVLQEDEKLLMYYDNALTRTGGDA